MNEHDTGAVGGSRPNHPRGRHQVEPPPRRDHRPAWLAAILVLIVAVLAIRVLGAAEPASRPQAAMTSSTPETVNRPSAFGNLVSNWSFERDLSGWRVLGAATAGQESAGRTSGSCAAVRANGTAPGRIGLALPGVVRSAHRASRYVASAWVRSTAPGLTVTVRLASSGGRPESSQADAVTPPGAVWRQVTVARTVQTAGATLDLEVTAGSVPAGEALLIDEVEVRQS